MTWARWQQADVPFQREAFDFATQNNKKSTKSVKSREKNHDAKGRGRILLADEMVCSSLSQIL